MGLTENTIKFKFKWLEFIIRGDKIDMAGADCYPDLSERCNVAEINVAGDNKPSHMGARF